MLNRIYVNSNVLQMSQKENTEGNKMGGRRMGGRVVGGIEGRRVGSKIRGV